MTDPGDVRLTEIGSDADRLTLSSLTGLGTEGYERTSLFEREGSNEFDEDRVSMVSSLSALSKADVDAELRDRRRGRMNHSPSSESLRDSEFGGAGLSNESGGGGSGGGSSGGDGGGWFRILGAVELYNLFFLQTQAEEEGNPVKLDDNPTTDAAAAPPTGRVKVMSENRGLLQRNFRQLRLAQTIEAHEGAIYALKFSSDGKFLATGGEDGKVMVWAVGQLRHFDEYEYEEAQTLNSGGSTRSRSSTPTPGGSHSNNSNTNANSNFNSQSHAGGSDHGDDNHSSVSHGSEPDPSASVSSSDRDGSEAQDSLDRNVILYPTPYREYVGHTESVLDLAWSGSNFILSASADRSVRLWRLDDHSRCLKLFGHEDIVTSVDFNPANDTHFVSGCFNGKVTLWDNIRGNAIDNIDSPSDTKNASLHVPITSVCFVPDGTRVFAGQRDGQIQIYSFKYKADRLYFARETTVDWFRDRKGKFSEGRKVTGICFDTSKGGEKTSRWLISSNDNNLRLIESISSPFVYLSKFKGGRNLSMQIRASFSEHGKFIICPTEHGRVLVWEADESTADTSCNAFMGLQLPLAARKNSGFEWFHCTGRGLDARGSKVKVPATGAVFAPAASVHRLLDSAIEVQRRMLTKRVSASADGYGPPHGPPSTPTSGHSVSSQQTVLPEDSDLCSSIIATADGDGRLRIFLRGPPREQ